MSTIQLNDNASVNRALERYTDSVFGFPFLQSYNYELLVKEPKPPPGFQIKKLTTKILLEKYGPALERILPNNTNTTNCIGALLTKQFTSTGPQTVMVVFVLNSPQSKPEKQMAINYLVTVLLNQQEIIDLFKEAKQQNNLKKDKLSIPPENDAKHVLMEQLVNTSNKILDTSDFKSLFTIVEANQKYINGLSIDLEGTTQTMELQSDNLPVGYLLCVQPFSTSLKSSKKDYKQKEFDIATFNCHCLWLTNKDQEQQAFQALVNIAKLYGCSFYSYGGDEQKHLQNYLGKESEIGNYDLQPKNNANLPIAMVTVFQELHKDSYSGIYKNKIVAQWWGYTATMFAYNENSHARFERFVFHVEGTEKLPHTLEEHTGPHLNICIADVRVISLLAVHYPAAYIENLNEPAKQQVWYETNLESNKKQKPTFNI